MVDRWWGAVAAAVAVAVAAVPAASRPARAQEAAVAATPFSAEEYLGMWDAAAFPGVATVEPEIFDLFSAITGDRVVDARIRELAEARGYRRQPVATRGLVPVDGRLLQPPAAEAWLALKAAARADGVALSLTSAHRSPRDQRTVFLDRMTARSDTAIAATLRFSAPPGYSKHQTGYTIDVGEPGSGRLSFGRTRAFAWLSDDDYAIPRSLGWIPSYPAGGLAMGPDPEPWELVWVGPGRVACARPAGTPEAGFCDVDDGSAAAVAVAWLAETGATVGCRPNRFCPDDPVTRGEAASLLWRLHGAPEPSTSAPFTDVRRSDPFAAAVDWLWSHRLTRGMTPESFGPDVPLTGADALALLVRVAEARDDLPAPRGIVDAGPPPTVAPLDAGPLLTRVELAQVLVAYAASR